MSVRFEPFGDYESRVRASYARQKIMGAIAAELTRVEAATVEIEMDYRPELTQQHGLLHAGIISTALDSACGSGASSRLPADAAALTIGFKVNRLWPGRGTRCLFRGSVTKPGRTIIVDDGQAYAYDAEGNAKLIATMTATIMTVSGRDDI